MSIEVRIAKEIEEYKEKIIFGMSIRQLGCFVVALTVGLGTYFLIYRLNQQVASYAAMVVVMPAFAVGFIRPGGYPFEKYIAIIVKHYFSNGIRIYQTELRIDTIKSENSEENRGIEDVKKSVQKEKPRRKGKVREHQRFERTKEIEERRIKELHTKIEIARRKKNKQS